MLYSSAPEQASANTTEEDESSQPSVININVHPDDAKCAVLMACMKALIMLGNRPCSPKELAAFILKHKLATLGGQTPYATVSSRISQHFKRCAEGVRRPLLGKKAVVEANRRTNVGMPRKWRYYVDQAGVPVADDSEPIEDIEPLLGMTGTDIEQWRKKHASEKDGPSSKSGSGSREGSKATSGRKRSAGDYPRKTLKAEGTPVKREPHSPPLSAQTSAKGSPEAFETPSGKRERPPQQEASPNEEGSSGDEPSLTPTSEPYEEIVKRNELFTADAMETSHEVACKMELQDDFPVKVKRIRADS
ncbi:hypothetical protein SpCBS45565_g03059 [Spizellomyces sp. 'palustris']|nr:hypothetical protein SpCBS45565_g03059 [Spizellomyces sp. 'palustris']